MNKEVMAIYSREGSILSALLPMVLQFPHLFGVERARATPSNYAMPTGSGARPRLKGSYYVLPVMVGVSMYLSPR